jgi:hypothetical protein
MKASQTVATAEKVHVFANDAPFLEPGSGHTLRMVTPDVVQMLARPLMQATAITLPIAVVGGTVAMYAGQAGLFDSWTAGLLPLVPAAIIVTVFPLVLSRSARLWTWDQPTGQAGDIQPGGDGVEIEQEQELPLIRRESDHVPCWEYTIQIGHERQLRRYFPPEYRDGRGKVHHVDIPRLRSFASVIVGRRFEWVDATRDETMRMQREQYNAIRDSWLAEGWIETMGDKKKRVLAQSPIHMIAEREPR